MLVLSRRAGERIQIGEHIEVTVVRIGPGVVRIGIDAPQEMTVMREEIRPGLLAAERRRAAPAKSATVLCPDRPESEASDASGPPPAGS